MVVTVVASTGAFGLASTAASATVSDRAALVRIGGPFYADGGPTPCRAAYLRSPSGSVTAPEVATAYGIDGLYRSGDTGRGITVAVVAYGPLPTAAIDAFDRCYGVTPHVAVVDVAPGTSTGGAPTPAAVGSAIGSPSDLQQVESAIDVETLSVLAPDATIVVYDDPTGTEPVDTILSAIVDAGSANVISDSYLGCESESAAVAESSLFEKAAEQNETVLAASGDDGAYGCASSGAAPSVADPASDPLVTAVGGTTIASAYPDREFAWSGSGGGVSSEFAMPSFQSGAPSFLGIIGPNSAGAPCGAGPGAFCRQVPDVSALAGTGTDGTGGFATVLPGGSGQADWGSAGGTSVSTPIWGAIVADLDSARGCGVLGDLNPKLYAVAAKEYRSAFHDVTEGSTRFGREESVGVGSNVISFAPGSVGFHARRGYDLATGLGSPRLFAPHGLGLASALCPDAPFSPGR